MKEFDQVYAEQPFELREMLESHTLQYFLNLPDDDLHWLRAKKLLEHHCMICGNIGSSFRCFHVLLLSASENIFFDQLLEII